MYIESVAIESFGSYKNFACTFDRGINIIEGPNESGKTTLGAFIKFIFYGLSRKAPQGALAEIRRFKSWDNDLAAGSLIFAHGGKRYRIERNIRPSAKASGGENVKIIDLATNSECFKGEHPGKLFFGVEEDAFSQTAYVGQADGGKVNGKTVTAAIENMLFAGDETVSTSSAQKKLDEVRIILKHKVRRGGKIVELEDTIDSLLRRRETARADNRLLFGKESEKRELSERFEKEKRELEIMEKRLERAREREKLSKFEYYDSLGTVASDKEKKYGELVEKGTFEGFLPDGDYIQKIESLRTKINYLITQIKQIEDDKTALGNGKMTEEDRVLAEKVREDGGIEKIRENVRSLSKKRRSFFFSGITVLVFGALMLALSAYCFLTNAAMFGISSAVSGVCTAAIGLALACFAVFMTVLSSLYQKKRLGIFDRYAVFSLDEIEERFSASSHRLYLQNIYDEKLSSIYERHKKLKIEAEKLESDMKALLGMWGREYTSPESPLRVIEEVRDLIKKLENASSEKDKAISARDAFVKTLEEYNREEIAKYLEGSAEYGDLEDGTAGAVKIDFDRRSAENRELGDEIRLLELDIAKLSATAEDPTGLSDEIERLASKKEKYDLCHDAYMLAIESISNAADKLRDDVAPRLAMQASSMMRKETMGKYEQLGVDENLSLAYGSDTGGVGNIVTRDIEYLSEGTKDLAYISLRIALVGLLFTKAKPPVLFDESFARLDDTRLENMMSVLDEVSRSGCQIFIFTSQTRDAKIMEKIGTAKHILLSGDR